MQIKYLKSLRFFKLCLIILSMFIAVLVAGCSTSKTPTNNKDNTKTDVTDNTPTDKPKLPDLNLSLYFVKYTPEDAYLVREVHTVPSTEQVAEAAMQELITDEKSILPSGTKVLGIEIENGLATINFSKEVLNNNIGSSGEVLGIQSIVNTMTEFPNIEKVSFEVEGKSNGRARDWWGHVGLYDQPFTRDLSRVYEPAIWVTHPSEHQVAGVPLLVKGSARVFEGTVSAKLLDNKGQVLAQSSTTATEGAPGRGNFEMSIKFEPPNDGEGTLEVYWASPKDGSIQDKVSIPVQWP